MIISIFTYLSYNLPLISFPKLLISKFKEKEGIIKKESKKEDDDEEERRNKKDQKKKKS